MFSKRITILITKTIRKIMRIMGKGATTLPGKVAIKLRPSILSEVSKEKKIITITGTNGKTTTSHMISQMIESMGYEVVNNISGANLASGIVTLLICDESKNKDAIYVLETDEAAFAKIAGDLNPKVSVVTNLFRDQLDRYGELTHTRDLIAGGIDKNDAILVLNSDDSLVASLSKGRENRSVFYGMNKESMLKNQKYKVLKTMLEASTDAVYCPDCKVKYEYESRSFSHLGNFRCPVCDFKSPENRYSAIYDLSKSPSDDDYEFEIYDSKREIKKQIKLPIPGTHNLYNTLCAIAAINVLLNNINSEINEDDLFEEVCSSVGNVEAAFGRMEKIDIDGKKLCILLVKNPAGLDRSLSLVSEASDCSSLFLLLNSNIADGKDVSWIWDVDFESKCSKLTDNIYVSGERYGDMLLRITYAGKNIDKNNVGDMSKAMSFIEDALNKCEVGKCVYVMPNYTSMLSLRGLLVKKYNLKEFWK